MSRFGVCAALLLAIGCRKDTGTSPDPDGDGVKTADGDCAPYDATTYPGAPELCEGRDNNCDGAIDEGVAPTWYADADGDGFGDDASPTVACTPPAGTALQGGDCDDADPSAHPGAAESCTAPADLNCDGSKGATDADNDGVPACEDCNDGDPDVHPGAAEICNDVDDDCNGVIDDQATDASTFYVDLDGDGHGSDRLTADGCVAPHGFVASSDDCDDLHPNSYPSAAEDCDGLDNDCDGIIDNGATGTSTWYADADHDGYGDPNVVAQACARPPGYVDNSTDCNDADPAYNPGATETCTDNTDYNCDGAVGLADGDHDGTPACSDCDDTRADVYPGATEICDGVDNNCNGQIDETAPTWYADVDGDGHGGSKIAQTQCAAPAGFVASSDDCDDLNANVAPGKTEACDGKDDDCDGSLGPNETDGDGDRYLACGGDCDDADATIHPGGVEICDGKDDNCNGTSDDNAANATPWFADADGDGYGAATSVQVACAKPSGTSAAAGDCDDTKPTVSPVAPELCATAGVDDDCDGQADEADAQDAKAWFLDADNDGHGAPGNFTIACSQPSGRVALGDDCNDGVAAAHPGAAEVWYDGIDENCDGKSDYDKDSDGFVAIAFGGNDCDDASGSIGACTAAQYGAGRTCQTILAANPTLPTGLYWIDPDNDGDKTNAFQVYCDMTTNGGGWTRVFYEDTTAHVFFAQNEAEKNKATPMAPQYAILNDLESFRRTGKFEFLMRWPGNASYPAAHWWTQTNNPVTDAAGALPTGYTSIATPYSGLNGWGGLQHSATPNTNLLDGTITPLTNWYFAVGTTYCWNGTVQCQPGPTGGTDIAELYVR